MEFKVPHDVKLCLRHRKSFATFDIISLVGGWKIVN